MDRHDTIVIEFTSEEAYEILLRGMASEDEDNPSFQSALRKLASALKQVERRAA